MCMILYQNVRNGGTYQTLFRAILADLDKQLPSGNCCVFGSNLWRFFSMMWRKSPWAAQDVCKTKHKFLMIPSHDQKGRWLRQPWLNQRQGLRLLATKQAFFCSSTSAKVFWKGAEKNSSSCPSYPQMWVQTTLVFSGHRPNVGNPQISNHQNPCIFRGGTYPTYTQHVLPSPVPKELPMRVGGALSSGPRGLLMHQCLQNVKGNWPWMLKMGHFY